MTIFINNKKIESFMFSGGECQVKIDPTSISSVTSITANLYNSNDIMKLLLAVNAIKHINTQTLIELTIPYFPYARQDRVCNEGEALSVKVMTDLINGLNCSKVTIIDPHSDVTPALLNNVQSISVADIICESDLSQFIKKHNLTIVSPDAGAEKKVRNVLKNLSLIDIDANLLCASKVRDTKTGNIVATNFLGDVKDKDLIIIDDICDGGRTFIELAKSLKEHGALDIYLYTTHGIYSQGLDVLRNYFKHIYCYHTMLGEKKIDKDFLTVISFNINQF
jgi:ribose-phosphate pyrophosphokinase